MRRLLLGACALRFLDSFILIAPFYTVMFAERGLPPAQIGVVLASWSVMGVALEAPCGVLADRVSRRWLLSVAQLTRSVGFVVWLAFPNFWGFLVGLMLWGLKSATLSGAFEALVYDELKAIGREGEYVRVIGHTQAARLSGVLAASLGAAVVAPAGYPTLIWASVLAGVGAAASALLLPKAPKAAAVGAWGGFLPHLVQGARDAAARPGVLMLLTFMAATQAVVYACADYWQIFGQQVGLSKSNIALFLAALAAVGATAAALAHRVHTLRQSTLYLLIVAAGACLVAAATIYQAYALVLLMSYVAIYWIVDVNADARFQHLLAPGTRATVTSLKGFVMQGGTSLLMLGFGLVAQVASYRMAFLAAGVLAMTIGATYAIAGRITRPAATPI